MQFPYADTHIERVSTDTRKLALEYLEFHNENMFPFQRICRIYYGSKTKTLSQHALNITICWISWKIKEIMEWNKANSNKKIVLLWQPFCVHA